MLHKHPPKRVEQMRREDETWLGKVGWAVLIIAALVELQTLVTERQGGSVL